MYTSYLIAGLFNLIFLPPGASVMEIVPCGQSMALVYNVAVTWWHEVRVCVGLKGEGTMVVVVLLVMMLIMMKMKIEDHDDGGEEE